MPKLTGIEVTKAIVAEGLDVSVIMLTMHDEKTMFDRAMNAGALGYVLKENAASDIVEAIRMVAGGKPYVSPLVTRHLLAKSPAASEGSDKKLGLTRLSPAERKVLKLIAMGRSSNEIAEELFISPKTVGHHRTHICDKLGITGPNVLLKFALEHKDVI
jgi:DNA-binding NarL/FixJ family response regulator